MFASVGLLQPPAQSLPRSSAEGTNPAALSASARRLKCIPSASPPLPGSSHRRPFPGAGRAGKASGCCCAIRTSDRHLGALPYPGPCCGQVVFSNHYLGTHCNNSANSTRTGVPTYAKLISLSALRLIESASFTRPLSDDHAPPVRNHPGTVAEATVPTIR